MDRQKALRRNGLRHSVKVCAGRVAGAMDDMEINFLALGPFPQIRAVALKVGRILVSQSSYSRR
jgi:hypothetical protein